MNQPPGDSTALSPNLRALCQQHGSITAVCRKLGINRQQFNKYLSGAHVPSKTNLRLIANHFGLSVPMLFSDPDEFRLFIEGNLFHAMSAARKMPQLSEFISGVFLEHSAAQDELIGVYDRYQFSSIYSGMIIKSALCIYRTGEFLQHYYIERFPNLDHPDKIEHTYKYYGFCFTFSDRVFMIDSESTTGSEMTMAIYAELRRRPKRFLFGITSGVSANTLRQPYSTRVALHYRESGLLKREHVSSVTVLSPDDPQIPREVLQFLNNGTDMIRF